MTVTSLTPHFTLAEFTVSETAARRGYSNVPRSGSRERANLTTLAEKMEEVRSILDSHPIIITSGYRSAEVNRLVGGSKGSAHMAGLAADFICPDFGTPLAICRALQPHVVDLGIDQLIHEFETWVHLGLRDPPRNQCLTIDTKGAREGL